jgi:hypothetical protein
MTTQAPVPPISSRNKSSISSLPGSSGHGPPRERGVTSVADVLFDSVKNGSIIAYHLDAANIGSSSLTDVSISFTPSVAISPNMMIGGIAPVTGTLPPRDVVRVPGTDPAILSKRRRLFVMLRSLEGLKVCLPAVYLGTFVLPDSELRPGGIEPRTFYEYSGKLRQGTLGAILDNIGMTFADALSGQPKGTASFWASEKTAKGDPNQVSFRRSKLFLSYDPEMHRAQFSSTAGANGLTLSFEPGSRHYVAVTWDEAGPILLFVDGKKD